MMRVTTLQSFAKGLFILLFLAVLAACSTVTETETLEALAKPEVEHYALSGEGSFPCFEGEPFEFELAFTYEFSGRVTTFFNRHGEPIRLGIHEHYYGTLTNAETGFSLVDGPDAWYVSIDLRDGTESIRGLYIHFRTPDGKRVAMDVGNITYYPDGTVKVAGPHDIFDSGICHYLIN